MRNQNLARRVTRSAGELALATQRREAAIKAAHAGGLTVREIASAAGLSAARIHQILHGK